MTYIIMGVYTCLVMGKRHRVKSHAMLGFGALMTVVFSSIAGYGLCKTAHAPFTHTHIFSKAQPYYVLALFLQVPFTSLTQVLPFILVGIGLDDAFSMSSNDFAKKALIDRVFVIFIQFLLHRLTERNIRKPLKKGSKI